ncbi:alkaline phosphatase D family protein [Simiduia sp. 21SJ11W-1]|uniref:alkaline phosphatase D family protein n=1 Tax=Simiduia sp. 21SJ11W-1 TaxID=2909669 RepID=UPI00209EB40B|nr:alkaline phosphatase D family protein [Simiduia sp. 21SJ11W-1]UTA47179.1 alkaline phosphatase D family protein [Simiduia sp. 21SJ11W-1]
MERASQWISERFENLVQQATTDTQKLAFDLLIVGSGYGGAIAAATLAGSTHNGKPLRIAVLERGDEFLTGMFPSAMEELPTQVRGLAGNNAFGQRQGLFDIRANGDMNVLTANGLGGGSLINAGVMAKPSARVFNQQWPAALREAQALDFTRTSQLLGATDAEGQANTIERAAHIPQKYHQLRKLAPNQASAAPITVALTDGDNQAGVSMSACNQCGDCATGCNQGAKNSLDVNLLVQAKRKGCELYTGVSVSKLQKQADGSWCLACYYTHDKLRAGQKKPIELHAQKVILAAGTLGSTEILMRSASDALPLSRRLGQGFSGNGDAIVVGYNQREAVNAIAWSKDKPSSRAVGPTITGMIDLRDQATPLIIEEMAVPAPMARIFAELYTTTNSLHNLGEPDNDDHPRDQPKNDPLSLNRKHLGHTALYAVMSDDGAGGSLEWPADPATLASAQSLPEGALQVRWPEVRNNKLFEKHICQLRKLAAKHLGGRILSNPAWNPLPDNMASLFDSEKGPLLTVHPLGGCAMADDAQQGVVNHLGQVFNAGPEGGLHEGLVVLDGAIIPTALGINPALTIAALALRAAEQLQSLWQWQAATAKADKANPLTLRPRWRDTDFPQTGCATEIEVNERLNGEITLQTRQGKQRYIAELTLSFAPKAAEDYFWTEGEDEPQKRKVHLKRAADGSALSELRLFEPGEWHALMRAKATEAEMAAQAKLIAPVSGELEIMHRQARTARARVVKAAAAYIVNRGLRDFADAASARVRGWLYRAPAPRTSVVQKIRDLCTLASHSGQVRLFEYRLQVHRPEGGKGGWPAPFSAFESAPTHEIHGEKHITYTCAANPIQQLSELSITRFPGCSQKAVTLAFDNRYLARRDKPLLRIVKQANLVRGFTDLLSFHCFFVRLLIHTHVWTFRKPDAPVARQPRRLAGPLTGLPAPEIRELEVDRLENGLPIHIRLTRYPNPSAKDKTPLVMLHGYSASSTTYAHQALDTSAAAYFHKAGRDIWLVDLRTSCGMLTAMLPWHFEDVAFKDIPLAFSEILSITRASQCDVIAHCMGAAMLSMAVLQKPPAGAPYFKMRNELPDKLRHVALSQVGPKVSFSPDNMTRGYLLKNVRHLLGNLPYQFRPSDAPSMAESVLDRLLQALPYPRADFARENPLLPGRKVRWSATRRRIDALFGRAFSLQNMPDRLLDHIDDIFGPLSLGTLAQTIHFALQEQITNYQGENCYATRENFAERWRFNTLTLHAADSGLADVGTATLMASALGNLERDGPPVSTRHHIFEGFGHQDLLIGRGANKVFKEIKRFFDAPARYQQPEASKARVRLAPTVALDAPALGPVIGPATACQLPVMLGVDAAGRAPEYLLFVRLDQQGQPTGTLAADAPGLSEHFQLHYAHPVRHQWMKFLLPVAAANAAAQRWLPILVHDYAEPLAQLPVHAALPANLLTLFNETRSTEIGARVKATLARVLPACAKDLAAGLARAQACQLHWPAPRTGSIELAVAACQYPAMLFDHACAYRSYERLGERLHKGASPSLMLLIGDQVYVDPTAGMADAQTYHERYVAPYHEWLKQPPVRDVLRRLPSYMMPDDHEIANDWDQQQGQTQHYAQWTPARSSYLLFQRQANIMPAPNNRCQPLENTPAEPPTPPLWQTLSHQKLALFLADSRTERSGRTPAKPAQPLMLPAQFDALKAWLLATPAEQPKLVATASMLLPRRLRSVTGSGAACQSDAWDGYPQQLHALLAFIAEQRIQNLLFVSGDEHLSNCVTITFNTPDGPHRCYSIHSSALNAPLPFVNTRPEELAGNETFVLNTPNANISCNVATEYFPGDGFALLKLEETAAGRWRFKCEFDREQGTRAPVEGHWE